MLIGKSASPGIGFGKALILEESSHEVITSTITDSDTEIEKLTQAIKKAKESLSLIYDKVLNEQGKDEAAIIEAHIMLVEDPMMLKETKKLIETEKINAHYAYGQIAQKFIEQFMSMDNEYFRERALDIKDISQRVQNNILGKETVNLSAISEDTIIIAHELTPSQTASINKKFVKGFITEIGGATSHTAIMARTLEIPAITGAKDITKEIKTGSFLAINATESEILVNPSDEEVTNWKKIQAELLKEKEELQAYKHQPTRTMDNKEVFTYGNIATIADLEPLLENGAEGIGLLRTEFLFMESNNLPSEEHQFNFYKKVAVTLEGKPATIRTMDIGGDKNVEYLNLDKEENPFLGYRAIRICLDRHDIFKPQLRALLRASAFGYIRIMFPMISSLNEIREAKAVLEECKEELRSEKIDFDENIEVGIMIEIPAAAIMSELLAYEVDFFSIGTNDLVQYTIAVDRMNEKIAPLYSYLHPAVLRLIDITIKSAHQAGISIGMCGSMAADPRLAEILLGMGLESFSMTPSAILKLRKVLSTIHFPQAQELARVVLNLKTVDEVKNFINSRSLMWD